MNFIKSLFKTIYSIFLTTFLVALVIFMVNNREPITIHLYPLPFDIETRTFLLMLTMFLSGVVFGLLACSKSIAKRMISNFTDQRTIKKLQNKIEKN